MSHPMLSDRVCHPMEMMASHARRHLIVCAAQGLCGHAMPHINRVCVLSNGADNMPRLTSSCRVCFLREMITFHTKYSPTVLVVQWE